MPYEIGTTQETMTELTDLTTPIPYAYRPQSTYTEELLKLGNGHSRSIGFPVITWLFSKLSVLERDQLREFCTDYSSEVYIKSSVNDNLDEERVFRAIMEWPAQEERKAGFRFNLLIRFLILEELDELS